MTKIAIVNAVYPPEPVVSAQIGRDLAVHLVSRGLDVTVLCPHPSRPIGAKYERRHCAGKATKEVQDGIRVVRVPSFTSAQCTLIARMHESVSFGRHACGYLEKNLSDVDVVYANAWPAFCQALIARHCTRHRIPFVLHIQDIYPESLMGKIPGILKLPFCWPLWKLDCWTVRQAAKVVVISENMRRTYVESRALGPERVEAVMNWADESRFNNLPPRAEACAKYGVPTNRFTFLYLGNIGPVAGLEGVIDAFHSAQLSQAQLVLAGDGSAKAACVERAKILNADNIHFISDPDAANVPLIQSLGDVFLLPMRRGTGGSSVPSKLIAYLFSGRPVLATVDRESDTARCISDADCGWVGAPEDGLWLTAKMTELVSWHPAALSTLGNRGREYGFEHFSKAHGVTRLAEIVCAAANAVD